MTGAKKAGQCSFLAPNGQPFQGGNRRDLVIRGTRKGELRRRHRHGGVCPQTLGFLGQTAFSKDCPERSTGTRYFGTNGPPVRATPARTVLGGARLQPGRTTNWLCYSGVSSAAGMASRTGWSPRGAMGGANGRDPNPTRSLYLSMSSTSEGRTPGSLSADGWTMTADGETWGEPRRSDSTGPVCVPHLRSRVQRVLDVRHQLVPR